MSPSLVPLLRSRRCSYIHKSKLGIWERSLGSGIECIRRQRHLSGMLVPDKLVPLAQATVPVVVEAACWVARASALLPDLLVAWAVCVRVVLVAGR